MNPGFQGKSHHVPAWRPVVENVAHPDHEGVVGDLMYCQERGLYQLWVYRPPPLDNYERHTVPIKWVRRVLYSSQEGVE